MSEPAITHPALTKFQDGPPTPEEVQKQIAEFMRQQRDDFDWSPGQVSVRYHEVKEAALERFAREQELHVQQPETTWYEGPGQPSSPQASPP